MTSDTPDRNRLREELFGLYIDRLNAGEVLDVNQIRADHPAIAEALILELEEYEALLNGGGEKVPSDTFGDYRIVRELGRGGMGIVYEAVEGTTERHVALKLLVAGLVLNEKAVSRFRPAAPDFCPHLRPR